MEKYQTGGFTGIESSLSPWAGPYVTEMLGRGRALASMPYTAYEGPLTAGESPLQQQAFGGLGALTLPTASTAGSFTAPGVAQQYMSPYLEAALEPQYEQARRQADIAQQQLQSQYAKAGAYGGSRQGVAEAELQRGLLDRLADITGTGYQQAYQQAADLFSGERDYGLRALEAQRTGGAQQRDIEQAGVLADIAQFEQERDFPYRQTQYMQSLLQGLPISTQAYQYTQPTGLQSFAGGAGSILDLLERFNLIG